MTRYITALTGIAFILFISFSCADQPQEFQIPEKDQVFLDGVYDATAEAFKDPKTYVFNNRYGETYHITTDGRGRPITVLMRGDSTNMDFGVTLIEGGSPVLMLGDSTKVVSKDPDLIAAKTLAAKFSKDMMDLLQDLGLDGQ